MNIRGSVHHAPFGSRNPYLGALAVEQAWYVCLVISQRHLHARPENGPFCQGDARIEGSCRDASCHGTYLPAPRQPKLTNLMYPFQLWKAATPSTWRPLMPGHPSSGRPLPSTCKQGFAAIQVSWVPGVDMGEAAEGSRKQRGR